MADEADSSMPDTETSTPVQGGANVSCRNKNEYMKLIRERLDPENLILFKESCFGNFIDVDSKQAQGQLIYLLYKHLDLKAIERRRISFIINDRSIELGPVEYFAITGLRFGGWEEPPSSSTIHAEVFDGKQTLYLSDIEKAFDRLSFEKKGRGETVLKLSLLLVLYGTLLMRHRTSKRIEVQYMHVVDDLEKFNKFPWGLVSYQLFVTSSHNVKLSIDAKLEKGKQAAFDVFGFTFPLQVFAYEMHKQIALHCATHVEGASKAFPRMLRWTTGKFFHLAAIVNYFEGAGFQEFMEFSDEERVLIAMNEISNDMVCPVSIDKLFQHLKVNTAKSLKPQKTKLSQGCSTSQNKEEVKGKGKGKGKGKEKGKVNGKDEAVEELCTDPSVDVRCSQRRTRGLHGSPVFNLGSPQRSSFQSPSSDESPMPERETSDPALQLMKCLFQKLSSIQSDINTLKNAGSGSVQSERVHFDRSMIDHSIELQSRVFIVVADSLFQAMD